MRDYNKLLEGACNAMLEKLQENSNKGDWSGLPLKTLLCLSDVETAEIKMAFHIFETLWQPKDRLKALKELRREFADRMNFDAMAIAECNRLIEVITDDKQ